jgi:3-oxoacyl-[acyl-carrier protein] reductase
VPDPFRLDGRTALVTGASRGIGAAIARALDELTNDPVVLETDLADTEAPGLLASAAVAALGRVDVLVNNAAIAHRAPTAGLTAEVVDTQYAVNVRAPLLLIAALIPDVRSIVNLSSISGVVGTPNRAAYAATKGAIDAATRSLAMELGPAGIRVNSVAPGAVVTDLWASNRAVPGVIEAIETQTALRRWATPEDIAGVVVFLASDAARFVTGETLCADGGMARTLDLYGGPV